MQLPADQDQSVAERFVKRVSENWNGDWKSSQNLGMDVTEILSKVTLASTIAGPWKSCFAVAVEFQRCGIICCNKRLKWKRKIMEVRMYTGEEKGPKTSSHYQKWLYQCCGGRRCGTMMFRMDLKLQFTIKFQVLFRKSIQISGPTKILTVIWCSRTWLPRTIENSAVRKWYLYVVAKDLLHRSLGVPYRTSANQMWFLIFKTGSFSDVECWYSCFEMFRWWYDASSLNSWCLGFTPAGNENCCKVCSC